MRQRQTSESPGDAPRALIIIHAPYLTKCLSGRALLQLATRFAGEHHIFGCILLHTVACCCLIKVFAFRVAS